MTELEGELETSDDGAKDGNSIDLESELYNKEFVLEEPSEEEIERDEYVATAESKSLSTPPSREKNATEERITPYRAVLGKKGP